MQDLFYNVEDIKKQHMATDKVLQNEFVNVNGIRMHYVTMGNGPLIVFLHGFPEFWYSWRHQIPFFSKHFKVVVPDMRGYGDSIFHISLHE
jgi:epoxide hydrolase 4